MFVPHASEFEQNSMVQTTWKFELFDKNMVTNFEKSVDAILENVSATETIV